jgi:hypothetical protein
VALLKVGRVLVSPVIDANVCIEKWAVRDTKKEIGQEGNKMQAKIVEYKNGDERKTVGMKSAIHEKEKLSE